MPAKKAATKKVTKRARKPTADGQEPHKFRHKLLLNQWLISLFGIDPFARRMFPALPSRCRSTRFPRRSAIPGWKDWIRTDSTGPNRPQWIEELETLNVFGVEADFMEKFREFLKDEGLPGNERKKTITIPLNVTFDFGKKLKVKLRGKVRVKGAKDEED